MDEERWLTFSAGKVEFEFYGTAASIDILGDSTSEDATATARQTHLAIELDGERVIDTMIKSKKNTYEVLADEKPAWHTVSVTKLSELNQSSCAITGITTTSVGPIRPTGDKELNIEFIGDSITCGYGVLGTDPNADFLTSTEDVTLTYAGVCADILEADYSVVANSGYGVYSGGCDEEALERNTSDLIPPIYNKVAGNAKQYECDDETTNVYNRTREFDVCVINLGTNDGTYTHVGPWGSKVPNQERIDGFVEAYVDFLGEVRDKNPNAKIVCTHGLMEDALWEAVQTAVAEYKSATGDTNVYTIKLPQTEGYGSGYHPDQAGQQTAGTKLASFIKSIL